MTTVNPNVSLRNAHIIKTNAFPILENKKKENLCTKRSSVEAGRTPLTDTDQAIPSAAVLFLTRLTTTFAKDVDHLLVP